MAEKRTLCYSCGRNMSPCNSKTDPRGAFHVSMRDSVPHSVTCEKAAGHVGSHSAAYTVGGESGVFGVTWKTKDRRHG